MESEILRSLRHVAWRLQQQMPLSMEIDDLIHAGWIGYQSAVGRWEGRNGASRHTFAMCRARGAMLDEIRLWRGDFLGHDKRTVAVGCSLDDTIPLPSTKAHDNRIIAGATIEQLLSKVEPAHKKAVQIMVLEDQSPSTAAKRLHVKINTVKNYRSQAIAAMRKMGCDR